MQIGRVGMTLPLSEPTSWKINGASSSGGSAPITVTALIKSQGAPISDMWVVRDQLLGLVNNGDEPVVPVIVPSEPRLTGYYAVSDVQFSQVSGNMGGASMPVSIVMTPVPGFANPIFESIMDGALLTNAVGAVSTDVDYFHAVSSSAVEYWAGGSGGTNYTRSSADGNALFHMSPGALESPASFYLTPADYYLAAATFEQGSTLRPVVGRRAQADLGIC